jgi:osmotically-inducible protein OsmY
MLFTRSAVILTAVIVSMGPDGKGAVPLFRRSPFSLQQATASQNSETAIVAAVKRALSGQADLRRLAVSADGSEVTLTGKVPTLWLKMDAVKRTLKVDGVKSIRSNIDVAKSESDTNLAAALGRAIDGYAYYTVFDYIDAIIRNGVITLTGSVTPDNRNKSEEITDLVAKVRGVQEIRNQIVTLPTSQGDDSIRASLYTRITQDTNFENIPIDRAPPFHIVVDHGMVTLYGWVQGEIEYRQLESIVRFTGGVLRVNNNLKTLAKARR